MEEKNNTPDKGKDPVVYFYEGLTLEVLEKIIEDVFKDYKDPTEGMTPSQFKAFDDAMKELIKKEQIDE